MSPVQVLPGAEGGWWSGKAGPGAKRPAPWSQLWQAEQLCSLSFLSLRLVNLEYSHWRFFKNNIFTYLASPGLSCGTHKLCGFLVACGIFSCSMWDLVPWPGIKPGPSVLGAWSPSHWTTEGSPSAEDFGRQSGTVVTRQLGFWPCLHQSSWASHLDPSESQGSRTCKTFWWEKLRVAYRNAWCSAWYALGTDHLMVAAPDGLFMCQLGWAVVPSWLVK